MYNAGIVTLVILDTLINHIIYLLEIRDVL